MNWESQDIIDLTQILRRQVNAPPIDLDKSDCVSAREMLDAILAEFNGTTRVAPAILWPTISRLLVNPGGNNGFEIRLSKRDSPLQDNVVIGQALGHLFLHYPWHSPVDAPVEMWPVGVTGQMERQARRFAAELLLPRAEFLELRRAYRDVSCLIAASFGVPEYFVKARMVYMTSPEGEKLMSVGDGRCLRCGLWHAPGECLSRDPVFSEKVFTYEDDPKVAIAERDARIAELIDLIVAAAPLTWAATGDLEAAQTWEKQVESTVGSKKQ